MTKIKNFRIHLRAREIGRLLKAKAQLQLTPALEASIEHVINDSKRFIEPSAVYTTLTRSTADKATTLPLEESAVAVSVIAVTIGPVIEEEILAVSGHHDAMQVALLSALREEALTQAIQFIMRLIETQAKEEECDMSAPRDAAEAALLGSLGSLLGVARIGIALDADTPQLPPYARLVWTVWAPKARAKAAAKSAAQPASARVPAGGRPEKAAASI